MKTAIFLTLALAGCSTVHLGTVRSAQGQSVEQRTADIATCADQGRHQIDTPERIQQSALAGATIIGAPIAVANLRAEQRSLFAQCMTARGYEVTP